MVTAIPRSIFLYLLSFFPFLPSFLPSPLRKNNRFIIHNRHTYSISTTFACRPAIRRRELIDGWEERKGADGKVTYHNATTGETASLRPTKGVQMRYEDARGRAATHGLLVHSGLAGAINTRDENLWRPLLTPKNVNIPDPGPVRLLVPSCVFAVLSD
jgi:hypothetical protein